MEKQILKAVLNDLDEIISLLNCLNSFSPISGNGLLKESILKLSEVKDFIGKQIGKRST